MISCGSAVKQMHEILDAKAGNVPHGSVKVLPATLNEHLADCGECRGVWEEMCRVERALTAGFAATPREALPPGFHSRLMAKLEEEPAYGERSIGLLRGKDKAQASLRTPSSTSFHGRGVSAFRGVVAGAAILLPGLLLFFFLLEKDPTVSRNDYPSAQGNIAKPVSTAPIVRTNPTALPQHLLMPSIDPERLIAAGGAGQVVQIGKSLVRNTSEAVQSFTGRPQVTPRL